MSVSHRQELRTKAYPTCPQSQRVVASALRSVGFLWDRLPFVYDIMPFGKSQYCFCSVLRYPVWQANWGTRETRTESLICQCLPDVAARKRLSVVPCIYRPANATRMQAMYKMKQGTDATRRNSAPENAEARLLKMSKRRTDTIDTVRASLRHNGGLPAVSIVNC